MPSLLDYITAGERLGLVGAELREFAECKLREEQQAERELRHFERDAKRLQEEKETETARLQHEQETKLKIMQLEIEKMRESQRLELEKQKYQFELDKEIALKKLELTPTAQNEDGRRPHGSQRLKLPYFTDKDNIQAYLDRYEAAAESVGIPKTEYAMRLSEYLTGKALDTMFNLPLAERNDYAILRQRLLTKFNLTEHGYRTRFRQFLPEKNQDFTDFINTLKNLFNKWLELAGVGKDFDRLVDLMLKDKVLSSCNQDLVAFFQERNPKDIQMMAQLGQNYMTAHPNTSIGKPKEDDEIACAVYTTHDQKPVIRQRSKSADPAQRYGKQMFQDNGHYNKQFGNSGRFSYQKGTYQKHQNSNSGCTKCGSWRHNSSNCNAQPSNWHKQNKRSDIICYKCQGKGHTQYHCPMKDTERSNAVQVMATFNKESCDGCNPLFNAERRPILICGHPFPAMTSMHTGGSLMLHHGYVNDNPALVLRDSGCTTIGVRKSLVHSSAYTGQTAKCITFNGTVEFYPLAEITVSTPYITGKVTACVLDSPVSDLIVGNVPTVKECTQEEIEEWYLNNGVRSNAVITRRQSRLNTIMEEEATREMDSHRETMENTVGQEKTDPKADFSDCQRQDITLDKCFEMSTKSEVRKSKNGKWSFEVKNGILTRCFSDNKTARRQVVVPSAYREMILKTAHDIPLAGHTGTARTQHRVLSQFYWPGYSKDIKLYCRSCSLCQKMYPKGKTVKAPVQSTDLKVRPFQKVAIDIIGPLSVMSGRGHRYILTMVDFCTRWPEAVALKHITTEAVAEALLVIFSRLGFPDEILSDRGSQFTSQSMREVTKLLNITQVFTSVYHPMSNGICEKFNGSLKQMLGKVTADHPSDWDKYLPAILFAYREVPQESTGFSPFELIYGANPRGPMTLLKEMLIGKSNDANVISAYDLVVNIRDRVISACLDAREALKISGARYRQYANRNSKLVLFQPDEEVLILLPETANRLLVTWQGPFRIISKVSDVDYLVNVKGKHKVYHVNMLRLFVPRPLSLQPVTEAIRDEDPQHTACSVVIDEDASCDNDVQLHLPIVSLKQTETWKDVTINQKLNMGDKNRLHDLLQQYSDVLTDVPGKTDLITHDIKLTDDLPIRVKPYPIPHHYRSAVETEINELLEMGIISRSESPYSFPMVVIRKKDNNLRLCIDFRRLNSVTVVDPEPMVSTEDLLTQISTAKYFSKLDLAKGYWQIPMNEDAKAFTAFSTPQGLFHWNYMPFGLVNSPATFVRMMRTLLQGRKDIINYIDDICLFSRNMEDHIKGLQSLFESLRQHNLTVKPSKVQIGYEEISFLGHVIGNGLLKPEETNVKKILDIQTPKTKKQVRSLLGLANFYNKFIRNFSSITAVLSALTQKGKPNKIVWTPQCEQALKQIKQLFSGYPILTLPNLELPFTLRVDASSTGIGGCLMQEYDGTMHPALFVSRKLSTSEMKFSTLEREALSIVWSVNKLSKYLMGRHFILQTDHRPLTFIHSAAMKNSRVHRWSILLQEYAFTSVPIRGEDNHIADLLSRNH